MAGEDVIIRIGADISAAESQIKTIEALLKNRSAFGKIAYQLGIDHKTFRANLNSSLADAQRIVNSTPLDLKIRDTSGLPRIRYALYDISNALQNVSTTAVDSLSTVVKTAASYETAFTRVEQTTGANAAQAAVLRWQLEQLASQIPMTFQDLSGIASLGAQMGVAQADIQSFTKNIAEFSSVTGVSAETAAQNFGTIGQLLGVSADQYANLGSAIAKAGVESVATEGEILSVSTQIAGVASASGLSAQYVVGLSTALASLKVPAEQSRGALTRVFQTVNRAAASGGQDLQNFASILGVTAQEAARLSQQDMGTFMDKFIAGLTNISKEAGPAGLTGTLDALGLSELRVTNTLTRLAQAPDLLAQSMQNSNQAFADGTFLGEQYAKKVDDIASKFQIIQNNFNTLMATIGAMGSGPLKFFVDAINNTIIGLQEIANSPAGPWVIGLGVALVALIGIVTTVVSTLALVFAGIFAVRTALSGLAKDTAFATSSLAQFTMGLFGVAAGEGAATVGARILSLALKAIPIIGVISIITTLAAAFGGMGGAADSAGMDVGVLEKAQKDAAAAAKAQNDALTDSQKGLNGLGSGASKAAEKIRTLVDYTNDLSSVFSRAFDIRFGSQNALDAISKSFSSIAKSTADARNEINSLNADIDSLTADKALQEYFLSVANAYGDTLSASKINANLSKINADLASKSKSLAAAQDKTNKTLVGNSDAAIENRAEIIGLVKNYQDYIKSLASSGMKQDELSAKAAQLKTDFIAQASQLGYNSAELGTYAVAFDDVAVAINGVPRNVTIEADTNPAITALNEFVAKAEQAGKDAAGGMSSNFKNNWKDPEPTVTLKSKLQEPTPEQWNSFKSNISAALNTELGSTGNMYTELFRQNWTGGSNWGVGMPWQVRAAGGPIYGPGTSTSDSIPAMLSNGEYVIQAAAVKQYGVGFFDQLNQMQTPHFFSGGPVSGGNTTGGIVSLSPEDRAILRSVGGSGEVVLYANSVELARSVNDGNRTIVAQGGRP